MQPVRTEEAAVEAVAAIKPFQIRGRLFTAVALRLSAGPDQDFYDALDAELRRMPHFFDSAPFVLDLAQCQDLADRDAFVALIEGLRRRNLAVFGVQNGTSAQTALAVQLGLLSLSGGRDAPLDRVERKERPAPKQAAPLRPTAPATLIVSEPVRSGQKVYADRGDLVVVASVSSGAELVAAGNIHVYGQLRGRALAGANGNESARIFCQSLDAELLAVAGLYLTSEEMDPALRRARAQAYLANDKLCLEALL
ncbi:MAG: septum site-determining protein MinC [Rhodobacteraceae bacterium]|nr:septum site-determining protein MinC [Paracoccaceae bacterium]